MQRLCLAQLYYSYTLYKNRLSVCDIKWCLSQIVTALQRDLKSCTEGHPGEQSLDTKN